MVNQVKSLYIHVPYCKHLCNYCDFYKLKHSEYPNWESSYHEYLLSTAKIQRDFLFEHDLKIDKLDTLYLGGGTPSLWGTSGANFFKNQMLNIFFNLSSEAEFTMEYDPGSWTEDTYFAWKDIGLNRVSIGAQSFSEVFLKILDRHHDLVETKKTLKFFSKEQINFSVDLLIGVPYSLKKKRNLKEEIDQLLSYNPSHLSLYILKTRKNYPHLLELPDDEFTADEYLFVCEYLKSQEFYQYEVSNFAKKGFESKHNQSYWDQESVAGLGPNATGFINTKDGGIRYQWAANSGKCSKENLTDKELFLESVYLDFRTSKPLKLGKYWQNEKLNIAEKLIENWGGQGLYCAKSKSLKPKGLLVLDSLMGQLFSHQLL